MDPACPKPSNNDDQEEWDADGFEIPSLTTGKPGGNPKERAESEKASRTNFEKARTKPDAIYLGPPGLHLSPKMDQILQTESSA